MRVYVSILSAAAVLAFSPLGGGQSAVYAGGGNAANCPVDLDMRHAGGLAVTRDAEQEDPSGGRTHLAPSQSFDVRVHNLGSRSITAIEGVVVTGTSGLRLMPTDSVEAAGGETEHALRLKHKVEADQEVHISWDLAGGDSVAYIRVGKVTYGDGTTWTSHRGVACRFAPDPMMLVSAR